MLNTTGEVWSKKEAKYKRRKQPMGEFPPKEMESLLSIRQWFIIEITEKWVGEKHTTSETTKDGVKVVGKKVRLLYWEDNVLIFSMS